MLITDKTIGRICQECGKCDDYWTKHHDHPYYCHDIFYKIAVAAFPVIEMRDNEGNESLVIVGELVSKKLIEDYINNIVKRMRALRDKSIPREEIDASIEKLERWRNNIHAMILVQTRCCGEEMGYKGVAVRAVIENYVNEQVFKLMPELRNK